MSLSALETFLVNAAHNINTRQIGEVQARYSYQVKIFGFVQFVS